MMSIIMLIFRYPVSRYRAYHSRRLYLTLYY